MRPQSIDDESLLARLAGVFRDVGYDGASLAMLSEAAGLQKASLYHRFPGGKQQMANEVLAAALAWFGENVIAPLEAVGEPAARLKKASASLALFYDGGRKACLLNMLAAPRIADGPFSSVIKAAFERIITALTKLARDAGHAPRPARARAERALMLLHGGLVVSRGMGAGEPFKRALADLPRELLDAD